MSGMWGGDVDQLNQLGVSLQQRTGDIGAITATVDNALANTVWTGPARDRFESEWHGSFKSALARMTEAFEAAGTECKSRAASLQQWGG